MSIISKHCSKCKELKPLSSYNVGRTERFGVKAQCRECQRVQQNEYIEKNRKEIYTKNNEAYDEEAKKKRRNRAYKSKYGITLDTYNEMLEEQDNVCVICGESEVLEGRSLAVDHCHTTGQVRGLLCQSCNTGLGQFKDNPALLENAVSYLEYAECR